MTGASSGIGRALCEALAMRHAHLIVSSRNATALESLAEELKVLGARSVTPIVVDLATGSVAAEAAAADALAVHGRLDLLFNNAGVTMRASVANLNLSIVRRIMEINFFAPVALARACLPMLRSSRGTIVNTSSISSVVHTPLRSSYVASKAGLDAYFDSLRLENPEVRVVSSCPGSTATDVSVNAIGPDGERWGKRDAAILNGLSADRVAERTLAATAFGIQVAWVAAPLELNATRLARYCPGLWQMISPWWSKGYAATLQKTK